MMKELFCISAEGKKAAIVGSGPAGLHAAFLLAKDGCKVELFEKEQLPGGMLQYYLPKFRFSRDGIMPKVKKLEELGVKVNLGVKIGKNFPLQNMVEEFDAVVLAPGEWNAKKIGLAGEELSGVSYWTGFLRDYNEGRIESLAGKKAVVVGAGDTAMDCARSAIRLGAEVFLAYRRGREEMPADRKEIQAAEEDGVEFIFRIAPREFRGSKALETIAFDRTRGSGNSIEKTGETAELQADLAVIAAGQQPDLSIFEGSPYKSFKKLPEKVVLSGDIVNEKKLIATAIASAVQAVQKAKEIVGN